ncbi:methyl-accepting chemotaxis protein [Halochromatium salexigens]|uniref:Methyl-accepting chemotaxis protein n=1 Tax=Halochromatium salexigens TaxID=49447 RepID=A0AAJ0UE18_HALSE|nr:methyl-accepting chemotaxis protein [Halochromatium salexigens]MBK5929712.1 methyl-accepting chemotaxis protein [Halochromatium salexigens]
MTLTIKHRLILLISIMLVLLLAVGGLGLKGMQSSNESLESVYEENLLRSQDLARIDALLRNIMTEMLLASQHDPRLAVSALHDHPTSMHMDVIEGNQAELDSLWKQFQETVDNPESQALAERFDAEYERLIYNALEPAMDLALKDEFSSTNHLIFIEGLPAYQAINKTLIEMIEMEKQAALEDYRSAEADTAFMRNLMIAAIIIAAVLGALLGWQLILRVTRPLADAKRVFVEMSKGNLTNRIQTTGKDEIGQTLLALADTQDKLRDLIINIQGSVESITTAANQISTGNTDLSQRTEQQASSLQETASSMEEVASTVKHNTENTAQANQLASQANASASKGGEKAQQAMGKMHELTESSDKISGIITLIDGIAFQTNILALNASVEAARAGEQGRGFAVVAQEVRNLAQRSADAAKQIQELIALNGDVVQEGRGLVEAVGSSMKDIVTHSGKVSELMDEVNRASNEQTMAIDQVSVAISQMDEVTQQNAALVEQTATASASLEDQTRDLAEAVAFFNVGEQASTSLALPSGKTSNKAAATHRPAALSPPPSKGTSKGGHQTPPKTRETAPATHSEDDWESF